MNTVFSESFGSFKERFRCIYEFLSVTRLINNDLYKCELSFFHSGLFKYHKHLFYQINNNIYDTWKVAVTEKDKVQRTHESPTENHSSTIIRIL